MKEEKGFKSRLGFILASVGSAVGLGNLWAFPYKAGVNGGAVFVLVYVIMALLIGFVAMISEMYIGKRTGKNIIDSYRGVNKHFGGMGMLGLVCTVVISSYYVLLAYAELESEGYIYSVPGKGSFANARTGAEAARKQELKQQLREVATELRYLGVTQEELEALLKEEQHD